MRSTPFPFSFDPMARTVALVILADVLFWGHGPGLSLAVFALALFAASLRGAPRGPALAVLVLSVLPVVEHVQALSLAFLLFGLSVSLVLQAAPGGRVLAGSLSLLGQLPLRGPRDLARAARRLDSVTTSRAARGFLRAWTLPLGGLLVLTSLLTAANPVLEDWLARLTALPFDIGPWLRHGLFWAGIGLIAWPLVLADPQTAPLRHGPDRPRDLGRLGLNPASVTRALLLFNAALFLQHLLDVRFLWAGTTRPGMTLAAYAHRGAYPLLATALLAGAFALAARPFLAEHRALKPLLLLWLGQNILLTLSALYRLDLYVQSFGLTYLRVHALIWMALVAAGLALTLWQIAAGRPNLWLVIRCATLGLATLYICTFINFADLIARTNVGMGKIDALYLCELPPTAFAAIPATVADNCLLSPPVIEGWRDWGFRNWRVLHNLGPDPLAPATPPPLEVRP